MEAKLTRITPRSLASVIPGTTERWWQRRMSRLVDLRDAAGRPIVARVGARYLGNLEALVDAILRGELDREAAA